jgi:2-polyprenyl-3-methyl-5-hydroxy-6-metoxy-1,4-benzoquinol methylase
MRQILSETERSSIRGDIYKNDNAKSIAWNDGKIRFFVKKSTGRNVLDLGCIDHAPKNIKSRFSLHAALNERAKKLVGLDYYEEGVTELVSQGWNVVYGDAQEFEFDDLFEIITAGDLIEHLPNLQGFFESCHKSLMPDGKLVLSTPNPWCWKYILYFIVFGRMHKINQEHVTWLCEETIVLLGKRFGFKVVDKAFSSRRWWELIVPLPKHLKHTTLNLEMAKSR